MEPMLAAASRTVFPGLGLDEIRDAALADPRWAVEVKHNGHRALVTHRQGRRRVYGKDGQIAARKLPDPVVAALDEMPFERWALDGELVDGVLWLFDIPEVDGLITTATPWETRRLALDTVARPLFPADGPVRVGAAATGADRALLWEAGMRARVEGFVLKRIRSPYLPGSRTRHWVKAKAVATVDCIVTRLRLDGKENMALALLGADGRLVNVGECSRLTGDGPNVEVGMVVEVTVLRASDGDRLVEPTKPMIRTDKRPEECTIDQLDDARRVRTLETT